MQSAICQGCGNTISAHCGVCDGSGILRPKLNMTREEFAKRWSEFGNAIRLPIQDAEIVNESEGENVTDSRMTRAYFAGDIAVDSKHYVAMVAPISEGLIAIAQTREEIDTAVTNYLRKNPDRTVSIYQCVASVGIKLDTETKEFA